MSKLKNSFWINGELVSLNSEIKNINNKDALVMKMVVRENNQDHLVEFFEFKNKKDGGISKVYSDLNDFRKSDSIKTIEKHGEGTKINVSGSLSKNHYVGQDSEIKHITKLQGKFIKNVDGVSDFKEEAVWQCHLFIDKYIEKTDATGEYTEVKTVMNVYGEGEVYDEFTFRIYNQAVASKMQNLYEEKSAGLLNGAIVNKVEAGQGGDDDGFGETLSSTIRHNYMTIVGGKKPLFNDDEEHLLSVEKVAEGKKRLEIKLTEIKSKKQNTVAKTTNTNNAILDDFADDDDCPF